MSEEKQEYQTGQPAAIIDPPRTVKSISENGVSDYKVWGWVKLSVKFLYHIKVLKGAKLAIMMTLALSVDETGKCKRTIKQLCDLTGYSRTEVIDSLKELADMGYVSVQKDAKGNIYDPEFVARGGVEPSNDVVKKLESSTVDSTPVDQGESSPSEENGDASIKSIKRVNTPKGDLVDLELSKLPAISVRKAITQYFGLNIKWDSKTAREFLEWTTAEGITAEQIETAAKVWKTDKQFNWQHPSLKLIFEKWNLLMQAALQVNITQHNTEGKGFYA